MKQLYREWDTMLIFWACVAVIAIVVALFPEDSVNDLKARHNAWMEQQILNRKE